MNPGSPAAASAILAFSARELMKLGRYDLAAEIARLVLAENEASADAHSLLAENLDELGRWQEALPHWQRAAELLPGQPIARFNLALAVLRLGDYRSGLPLHEARVARPEWTCRGAGLSGRDLYEARIDKPDWTGFSALPSRAAARARLLRQGAPVAGRTILVLTEQGLGDCIMFARYVPMLAERGARVLLACSPELRPVFARIPGIAELLSPPPEQPMAKLNLAALAFDAWVPLLSLPLHLGGDATEAEVKVPYLRPDPVRCADWRARYGALGRAGAPKIGLVYQANPAGRAVAQKSLRPADLAPLLSLSGIDWIVLHQGEAARELAAHPGVIDPELEGADLYEFAAAVAATDLLLTVDTMAAHCAGAIGHAVWVMVPFNPHWYWGIGGETTPWYPTLRLARQQAPSDWSGTIRRIAEDLRARFQTEGG
jgi:hypothetical protein